MYAPEPENGPSWASWESIAAFGGCIGYCGKHLTEAT